MKLGAIDVILLLVILFGGLYLFFSLLIFLVRRTNLKDDWNNEDWNLLKKSLKDDFSFNSIIKAFSYIFRLIWGLIVFAGLLCIAYYIFKFLKGVFNFFMRYSN
jgi:hypothetical protein